MMHLHTVMSITHSNHIAIGSVNTTTHTFLQSMTTTGTTKVKLKDVTFTRGSKPMRSLLWCNKVPKGKRNKPAKINGVQHHEISDSVEHTYYQPVN
jgi:hypothetical protein